MKQSISFLLIILFSVISNISLAQTDSVKSSKPNPEYLYAGFGLGPNNKGLNFGWSLTMLSSGGLGGSVHLIFGYHKLEDVPPDFYDTVFRRATPRDNFTALSFNLAKKFKLPDASARIGFEIGPSWFRYTFTELVLNPDWPALFEYKYNKIYTKENVLGLSMAMKADFPFNSNLGCDLTFFVNINSIQSIVGLDFCIDVGRVSKYPYPLNSIK